MLAEYDGSSGTSRRFAFIYAGNQRIAMIDSDGKLHFYLNDHLGSARIVIDTAGTVKDSYDYYAFGEALNQTTSTGQSYRYTGKPFDNDHSLNLHYYGARYYDATIGRFTSVDPLAFKHPGLTPYHYTANNPIAFLDPFGLDTLHYNSNGDLQQTDQGGDKNIVYVEGNQLVDQPARETMVTQAEGASTCNETGGVVTTDLGTGNHKAIPAKDGQCQTNPSGKTDIQIMDFADPTDLDGTDLNLVAGYHSHPVGGPRPGTNIVDQFDQGPSTQDFIAAKKMGAPTNYVLSVKNNTVYIYDGNGVKVTFPLDKFKTVGK